MGSSSNNTPTQVTFPTQVTKTIVLEVYNADDLQYLNEAEGFNLDFTQDMEDSGFKLLEIDGVKVSS